MSAPGPQRWTASAADTAISSSGRSERSTYPGPRSTTSGRGCACVQGSHPDGSAPCTGEATAELRRYELGARVLFKVAPEGRRGGGDDVRLPSQCKPDETFAF